MWLAGEKVLPLKAVVSLAGATDLRRAWELKLGKGAASEFLGGGPAEQPERYHLASPIERLPLKVPVHLIHGVDDEIVPMEISEAYAAAASTVQDDVHLVGLPGVGHSELIDPATSAGGRVISHLRALI